MPEVLAAPIFPGSFAYSQCYNVQVGRRLRPEHQSTGSDVHVFHMLGAVIVTWIQRPFELIGHVGEGTGTFR